VLDTYVIVISYPGEWSGFPAFTGVLLTTGATTSRATCWQAPIGATAQRRLAPPGGSLAPFVAFPAKLSGNHRKRTVMSAQVVYENQVTGAERLNSIVFK
jgi:hypothetical protein